MKYDEAQKHLYAARKYADEARDIVHGCVEEPPQQTLSFLLGNAIDSIDAAIKSLRDVEKLTTPEGME